MNLALYHLDRLAYVFKSAGEKAGVRVGTPIFLTLPYR
jgi:hypothetical protein